jgi:hypothetical protein
MNAISSGFVIGGRDNASFGGISLTANDNGFPFEFRSPFLLNSGKEGVHVDMKDSSHRVASELWMPIYGLSMIYLERIDPRAGTK